MSNYFLFRSVSVQVSDAYVNIWSVVVFFSVNFSLHYANMKGTIVHRACFCRGHLYTMGLFDGYPICRFCGMETETVQHIICCCEALARQRYYVFGRLTVEPEDISTASVRDLCLFIRGAGLLRLCWMKYWGCTIGVRLWCIRCMSWRRRRRRKRRSRSRRVQFMEIGCKVLHKWKKFENCWSIAFSILSYVVFN